MMDKQLKEEIVGLIKKTLPAFPTHKNVEEIAQAVIDKSKDKTVYAAERHTHAIADVRDAKELVRGLAPLTHFHKAEEIEGLQQVIDKAVASVEVPADFAQKSHTHTVEEVTGQIPLSKIAGAERILLALNAVEELKQHKHADLEQRIAAVEVREIPEPVASYDDTELRNALIQIVKAVKELQAKPEQKPVKNEIVLAPVQSPQITAHAEYLVLASEPRETTVSDAKGQRGTVKLTARGEKHIVRAEFQTEPTQPLTFTFGLKNPPPVLCSIGTFVEEQMS